LLFASFIYFGVLLLHNYGAFVHLGIKVAINGRYLFPIALPCMLVIALAYKQALVRRRTEWKLGLLGVVFILFLQGGGALSYITDSNTYWYWPNKAVSHINEAAQDLVKPLIIIKTPLRNLGYIKLGS